MIRAVVTDIEGTTSSLSFVKEVLFPYARRRIGDFLREHGDEPRVAELVAGVRRIMGREADLDEVIAQLVEWIDQDRKITPLKALQGLVWEHGYRCGDFTGHVYEDAVRVLRDWHAQGLRLYVYSSGSVHAQKLLFSHTPYGDLTPLFAGYFDTRTGPKLEAASYRRIAGEVGLPPGGILFLSDAVRELDAAREAGMRTCQLVRDGTPRAGGTHPEARDFTEIDLTAWQEAGA